MSVKTKGKRVAESKSYPDVIEGQFAPQASKWISDCIIKGRRIILRGIDLAIVQHGRKCELQPSIPAMSRALDLLKANPDKNDIRWNRIAKGWELTPEIDWNALVTSEAKSEFDAF